MAMSLQRYPQYAPGSPADFVVEVERGGTVYLVTVGSAGLWASFNTSTPTNSQAYSGLPSGTSDRVSGLVSYNNYAWAISYEGIYRLNPATGGLLKMTPATSLGSGMVEPNHVLVNGNLWLFPSASISGTTAYPVLKYDIANNALTNPYTMQRVYAEQHTLYAFGSLWNRTGTYGLTLQRRNLTTGVLANPGEIDLTGIVGFDTSIIALAVGGQDRLWWGWQSKMVEFNPTSMTVVGTYASGLTGTYRDRLVVGSDGRIYGYAGGYTTSVYIRAFDTTEKQFSQTTDPLLNYQDILFARPSDGKLWSVSGSINAR